MGVPTLEFLLNLLWNLVIANLFVFASSSISFLNLLQVYLTYNTLYIFEAVEPLSLLFVFFVFYNTLSTVLNYYFQLFTPSVTGVPSTSNTAKATLLPTNFWYLYKLNVLATSQTAGAHIRK